MSLAAPAITAPPATNVARTVHAAPTTPPVRRAVIPVVDSSTSSASDTDSEFRTGKQRLDKRWQSEGNAASNGFLWSIYATINPASAYTTSYTDRSANLIPLVVSPNAKNYTTTIQPAEYPYMKAWTSLDSFAVWFLTGTGGTAAVTTASQTLRTYTDPLITNTGADPIFVTDVSVDGLTGTVKTITGMITTTNSVGSTVTVSGVIVAPTGMGAITPFTTVPRGVQTVVDQNGQTYNPSVPESAFGPGVSAVTVTEFVTLTQASTTLVNIQEYVITAGSAAQGGGSAAGNGLIQVTNMETINIGSSASEVISNVLPTGSSSQVIVETWTMVLVPAPAGQTTMYTSSTTACTSCTTLLTTAVTTMLTTAVTTIPPTTVTTLATSATTACDLNRGPGYDGVSGGQC